MMLPKSIYLRSTAILADRIEVEGAKATCEPNDPLRPKPMVDLTTIKHGPEGYVTFKLDLTKLDADKFEKVGGGWWQYQGNIPAAALKRV